jgi:hypothetical protein
MKHKNEVINLEEFARTVRRLVSEAKAIGVPMARIRDLEGLDVVIASIEKARDRGHR